MSPVVVMLVGLGAYALIGAAFGVAFVIVGVKRVDPVAAHAPVRVRLLFLPGAAALWPILLGSWVRKARGAKP